MCDVITTVSKATLPLSLVSLSALSHPPTHPDLNPILLRANAENADWDLGWMFYIILCSPHGAHIFGIPLCGYDVSGPLVPAEWSSTGGAPQDASPLVSLLNCG